MIRNLAFAGLVALSPFHVAAETIRLAGDAVRPVVSVLVSEGRASGRVYAGTVTSKTKAVMAFQTLGRITERNVDVGDVVSVGDVLARISLDALDEQMRAARAQVAAAQAALTAVQASSRRADELVQRGVATQIRKEQADQAVQTARAQLEQARTALASAQDNSSNAVLRAPDDGVITQVFVQAGRVVSAGEPVLTLAGLDTRELIINVPAAVAEAMQPGQAFRVTLPGADVAPIDAVLDRVDPLADPSTRGRTLYLALNDPPTILRIGSVAQAQAIETDPAVVVLPEDAILRGADHIAVWRVTRDADETTGTVRRVLVGGAPAPDGIGFRVEDGSVSSGDEIVLRGVNSLSEGMQVGKRIAP